MILRILRHDLRLLVADRSLPVFALMFTILLGYAFTNGVAWTRARTRAVDEWQEGAAALLGAGRRQVEDIERRRIPASAAPFAGWVFTVELPVALRPSPLAPLSIGQADLHPFLATVTLETTKDGLFRNYETDNPLTLLSGRFDPAFAIVYLLPLLVLGLTYDLLARERDEGTLALTLTQPVRLHDVALGKILARLSVALALAVGLTLAGLLLGGASLAEPGVPAEVAWTLLMVAAYTLFWFAVSAWVSARGGTAAFNATVLFAIWLLLVVIVPSVLSIVVTSVYPVPSRLQFVEQMRHANNEIDRLGERVLAQYRGDHPELAPPGALDWNDLQSRFYVIQTTKEAGTLPLVRAYETQLARQQRVVDWTRFLSPAVLLQEGLNAAAGTDRERFRLFREQAEAFLDEWRLFAVPRSFRRVHLRSTEYASLPRFSFRDDSTGRVAASAVACLAGLLVPTLAAAWFAMLRLRRFPVAP
jgi:ABC-2 type transport system permease protein